MSLGVAALILGIVLAVALIAGPGRWWFEELRRRRATELRTTARAHAIEAEEQRAEAATAEREALTPDQVEVAAREREEAERRLEAAAREGERARAIDPDREADPDLNAPERGEVV